MYTAEEIWAHFIQLPGALVNNVPGIASQHAIGGLIRTVTRYRPVRILEIGAGIGTLTYTLLSTAEKLKLTQEGNWLLVSVENNQFCLEQLDKNLIDAPAPFEIHHDMSVIKDSGLSFDLIVVDGGGDIPGDMGVMEFDNMLAPGGVIFIEGYRKFQRDKVEEWYGHRTHANGISGSMRKQIVKDGITAKNKAYRLVVFEPRWPERLMLSWITMRSRLFDLLRRRGATLNIPIG